MPDPSTVLVDVNVGGATSLLSVMQEHGVHQLVFSSSCSFYGEVGKTPLAENAPACPVNPSAASKWVCEQILAELCRLRPEFTVLTLRYFNPVGAHPSGLLGQAPRSGPANLMPRVARVAAGRHVRLSVFGGDYDTADGAVVRDCIHVMDLAEAHRSALGHLADRTGMRVFNLGGGSGTSVLELLQSARRAASPSRTRSWTAAPVMPANSSPTRAGQRGNGAGSRPGALLRCAATHGASSSSTRPATADIS
ncbi:NAD-dependent epimerase/dehydratase family protein [Streptomyces lunaelactis]|uniref:NAD-dependent epimerase/dehydratase family protein n=1 Tax=Streptomyces lunaelactis TaxID=1535768 RepID=UPI002815EFCE|nr:NAD-dependent epimerase/dehydratase family protein [Streptomyces lunaelactis]